MILLQTKINSLIGDLYLVASEKGLKGVYWQKQPYQFHDYKKAALDEKTLDDWLHRVGWQAIVNQKGTTWRKLALDKNTLDNQSIKPIILQNLSMIKRPLLVLANGQIVLGFDKEEWQKTVQA